MKRSAPIARKTRLRPVNRTRKAREFERAYGSRARVEWVQSRMCCACSAVPCENAHYVTGGMGRKAGSSAVVPLCAPHHRMLHRMGIASFERYMGWSPDSLARLAALTEAAWQRHQRGDAA